MTSKLKLSLISGMMMCGKEEQNIPDRFNFKVRGPIDAVIKYHYPFSVKTLKEGETSMTLFFEGDFVVLGLTQTFHHSYQDVAIHDTKIKDISKGLMMDPHTHFFVITVSEFEYPLSEVISKERVDRIIRTSIGRIDLIRTFMGPIDLLRLQGFNKLDLENPPEDLKPVLTEYSFSQERLSSKWRLYVLDNPQKQNIFILSNIEEKLLPEAILKAKEENGALFIYSNIVKIKDATVYQLPYNVGQGFEKIRVLYAVLINPGDDLPKKLSCLMQVCGYNPSISLIKTEQPIESSKKEEATSSQPDKTPQKTEGE